MLDERLVRLAAFHRLEELERVHGDVLPWSVLREGFIFGSEQLLFMGPQGIFKPALMHLPLSITTSPEKPGVSRPYDDELGEDGFLRYRYRGRDPQHRDNRGVRDCFREGLPLIYFHGVGPGLYQALRPVYIHADDPGSLTFTVAIDDPQMLAPDLRPAVIDEARRRYTTRLAVQRLHQAAFRQKVLVAYRTSCAICRLRHVQLLDAAHILADSHPRGHPVVPNGLALCKIHHAAYDANIVGIRTDLVVEVSEKVLREVDGPMLRYGLQEAHGSRLIVPRRAQDRPEPEFLEERYAEFRRAS
jgi:putative restriction endonuclease